MKRHILIPALLLMAVAACNKSVEAPGPQTEKETGAPIHFISNAQGGDTKVTLDGLNLKWAAGDQIAVYSYKDEDTDPAAMNLCSLTSGAGQATATFAPTTNLFGEGWVKSGSASDNYTFYSWYPTSAAPTGSSETVANVAAAQNEGHLGDYLICWAQGNQTKTRAEVIAGDTPSFAFSPKVALLKVSIKNSSENAVTLNSIHVETNSGYIAGDVALDVKAGTIGSGTSSSIDYTPASPIDVASGNTTSVAHTIAVLPNAGNLTITATSDDFNLVFTSNGIVSVSEGHCYSVTIDITSSVAKIVLAHDDPKMQDGSYYYGEANCVVIPRGTQSADLDVSLYKAGADHARGAVAPDYLSAANYATVIWTEGMVLTPTLNWSGNQCMMTVSKANATDTGNALVGLYDSSDNLLWSFHVWAPVDAEVVTDDLPTGFSKAYKLTLGQVTSFTDTYMYYQWGRKDPLGRAAGYGSNKTSLKYMGKGDAPNAQTPMKDGEGVVGGPVALNVARKNPTVFYTRNQSPYDWISTKDDKLWDTSSSTVYDPCPKGYHVPSTALWSGVNKDNWNMETSPLHITYNTLTYTSGGRRLRSDGSVDLVGTSGYCLSGSVDGIYGVGLAFDSVSVARNYAGERADGYAVRCVQN